MPEKFSDGGPPNFSTFSQTGRQKTREGGLQSHAKSVVLAAPGMLTTLKNCNCGTHGFLHYLDYPRHLSSNLVHESLLDKSLVVQLLLFQTRTRREHVYGHMHWVCQ